MDASGDVGRVGGRAGGPLAGVRVVDGSDSSARLAGKLLAELGATVVRTRPGEPGAPMVSVDGGLLDWWFDGGTVAAPLDLASDADRSVLRSLVAGADILVETGLPGPELTPEALRSVNPRLAHVTLSPFGADGPRAHWQSSDLVMAAAGGVLSVNGTPEEPVTIWGRQMDGVGGFYAAICGMTGLRRARTTGRGMHVDLSHQQAVVSCSDHVLMFWWFAEQLAMLGGPVSKRQWALHWTHAYDVVPCKRGHCMVSPSAGGVPQLFAWMAEHGHVPAPVDLEKEGPVALIHSYMDTIKAFALEKDATEVFEGGQARHVPFGEVLTVPQVSENPQHAHRGFFRHVEGAPPEVRLAGPAARFGDTPAPAPVPPPSAPLGADEVRALAERWVAERAADAGAEAGGAPSALPLAGLRVVDFTHVLAGPYATRILADLGAEVVKVQTQARAVGGLANEHPYFAMWNRSKSSVTLKMSDPRALDVLRQLVERSDVVIENFSAGVLDEWGAGWEQMSAWNERVIYVSMQGAVPTGRGATS